jgi:hypothetical protein
MEATSDVVDVKLTPTEDQAISMPAPDVEDLNRQRIRFDGFFTGPTW